MLHVLPHEIKLHRETILQQTPSAHQPLAHPFLLIFLLGVAVTLEKTTTKHKLELSKALDYAQVEIS